MRFLFKSSICLIFLFTGTILIMAQTQDALQITSDGNVNVPSGKIQEKGNDLLPKGAIIMWYGDKAPAGWAICDGSNGTPDLRGRFVVGADGASTEYKPNAKGGQSSIKLTEGNLPGHSHGVELTTDVAGNHRHNQNYVHYRQSGGDEKVEFPMFFKYSYWPEQTTITSDQSGDHQHKIKGNTETTGGNTDFDNRPPYYALYYIMKL